MLTQGEAMVIEYKALKCLRQSEEDARVFDAAEAFAHRAARLLHQEKYYNEASSIAKKLLTITKYNFI